MVNVGLNIDPQTMMVHVGLNSDPQTFLLLSNAVIGYKPHTQRSQFLGFGEVSTYGLTYDECFSAMFNGWLNTQYWQL